MIDDRNDIRQAFAGPRASGENVVPAGTRPANRIGLVLIEPKDLAVFEKNSNVIERLLFEWRLRLLRAGDKRSF